VLGVSDIQMNFNIHPYSQHPISPQNTCFAYKFGPECQHRYEENSIKSFSPFSFAVKEKKKRASLQLSLCGRSALLLMHMQLYMAQRVRFAIPCSKFFSIYLHMSQKVKNMHGISLCAFSFGAGALPHPPYTLSCRAIYIHIRT
jgi:hypothetical protein